MHRYNPLSRLRDQGFTLIESLIIVFVIGVVAVIATPSFGQMLDSFFGPASGYQEWGKL